MPEDIEDKYLRLLADKIRNQYPLTAAVLDTERMWYSGRFARFVVAIDLSRTMRRDSHFPNGIPSVFG